MRVRVVVLVYLALFVGELSWSGVTPLIPSYIATYELSDFQGGMVLSVASFGILVASLPASAITRRASARTLTLGAMAVIALAGYAMALAPTYQAIVVSRLVFGLGFGVLWMSMAAWLVDASGEHSARVLAATTAVVGVSSMLGPAYAGWVARHFGLSAPFVGLAVITTALFVGLLFDRSGTGRGREEAPPARELGRAVAGDPDIRTMLLITIGLAVVWMTADLLVPLRLDDGGMDVAQIGFAFSLSSLVFAGTSAVVARGAERWARPSVAALGLVGLAACTVVPAVLLGVPAALVFLFGAAVASGVLAALAFPFGLLAVQRGAVTVSVMSAITNVVWAVSGMLGPTVGGTFADAAGDQVAFGVLAASCLTAGIVVARQIPRPVPEPEASG